MKLNIDFEELVDAFEESDVKHHYFIDPQKNELICINEAVDEDYEKRLKEMDNDRHLMIPVRLSQDNFMIMELFVYDKIQDSKIAEKFHQAFVGKNPFRNFKDLLLDYPTLQEQWAIYHREHLKNETINWLCLNNIELENQNLIPTIQIKELTPKEIQHMPDEIKDFKPSACLHCHNKKGMKARIFSINISPENKLIEQETQRIMKEQFGITHHCGWSGGEQEFLTASRCTQCGSEEIFWDY